MSLSYKEITILSISHSFTKEPERKGCLFADYRYRYGNNNLVIYGHNNYDGRGFSILSKYKDSLFAESHNEIVFIREDGTVNRYRVFLVVNYDTEDVSVCDPFLQDLPESFLVRIRKYPVYYYDDSIADLMERMIPTLILSTCDTEAFGQSGRLLVAGAQISSSANRKNDYHNTVNLVYNSANEEFRLQNNLDKRRRKLDDILGINEIPKLDSYDEIITKKQILVISKFKMKNQLYHNKILKEK